MIDVVVFTCAKYSALIPKFLTCFERTFPLPYQLTYVVAGTNRVQVPLSYNHEATRFVTMQDNGMAANMLDYLADKTEPFLMLMDDFMLFEANTALVRAAHKIIGQSDIGCVRLVPWPGPTLLFPDLDGSAADDFGDIDKSLEYAISLQASFWKPQTFRDLLDRHWNPWEIELKGSQKARDYGKRFVGCKQCAINYKDYMLRGNPRPEHAAWVDANL
jgi:hypothetical protein